MTNKLFTALGALVWLACAIFTAVWVHRHPEDISLAAVVWTGGVLSGFLARRLR